MLAAVAFVRDAALAEALKDVRRLESLNQQVSVSSTALTDKLAAVTADRNMKMKAMKHMSTMLKDKATRISKEATNSRPEHDTTTAQKRRRSQDGRQHGARTSPTARHGIRLHPLRQVGGSPPSNHHGRK